MNSGKKVGNISGTESNHLQQWQLFWGITFQVQVWWSFQLLVILNQLAVPRIKKPVVLFTVINIR